MAEEKNYNNRFIITLKDVKTKDGSNTFMKAFVDSPTPEKKDGTPDAYHKGMLLWYDNAEGKYYHVKSLRAIQPTEKQKEIGYHLQLTIDLNSQYDVTELAM